MSALLQGSQTWKACMWPLNTRVLPDGLPLLLPSCEVVLRRTWIPGPHQQGEETALTTPSQGGHGETENNEEAVLQSLLT